MHVTESAESCPHTEARQSGVRKHVSMWHGHACMPSRALLSLLINTPAAKQIKEAEVLTDMTLRFQSHTR